VSIVEPLDGSSVGLERSLLEPRSNKEGEIQRRALVGKDLRVGSVFGAACP